MNLINMGEALYLSINWIEQGFDEDAISLIKEVIDKIEDLRMSEK